MPKTTVSRRRPRPPAGAGVSYVARLDEQNNRTGYSKYDHEGRHLGDYSMPEYLQMGISQRKKKKATKKHPKK
jgi:hypothetical protein